MKKNVKKTLKIAGAFAAATGVVAISALVASGATVGAVVEGFKSAGKVVKKKLEEAEPSEQEESAPAEEADLENEVQEVVKEQNEEAVTEITEEPNTNEA